MKLISCLLLLAPFVPAQAVVSLKMSEVLIDPVGKNAGRQIIEYQNTGNVTIDTAGWYLAAGATTIALPALKIPIGTIGRVHLGRSGTSSKADIFLPVFRTLQSSDSLAFFTSNKFSDPKALNDFVSWGGGQGFIAIAVQANEWKSTFDTVKLPTVEGHTIAHYMRDIWGSGNAASAWYRDGTPTVGLANDPGSIFGYEMGCPKMVRQPGMGLLNERSRAWLGELWEVDLYNLPQARGTALVAFSTQRVTPIPLDLAGMPGCNLNLRIDALIGVAHNLGSGKLIARIPVDRQLIGFKFFLQALIRDRGYPNVARAAMTPMVGVKVGSR